MGGSRGVVSNEGAGRNRIQVVQLTCLHSGSVVAELFSEYQLVPFKTICFEITALQGALLGLNEKQITFKQTVNDR